MNRELISVIDEIGRQKGIDKTKVIGAIEAALQTAAKKRFGQAENIQVEIDSKTGEISVVSKKIIVESGEQSQSRNFSARSPRSTTVKLKSETRSVR